MGCRGRRGGRIFMAPAQSPTRGNERRADGRRCVTRSFPLSLTLPHSLIQPPPLPPSSSSSATFHLASPPRSIPPGQTTFSPFLPKAIPF